MFFLLGTASFVTVGGLLMLLCFSEMGFTSSSLFLVFFFQCLLFSDKTRENLGKLILNHGVFVFLFLFLFHWG